MQTPSPIDSNWLSVMSPPDRRLHPERRRRAVQINFPDRRCSERRETPLAAFFWHQQTSRLTGRS